MERKMSDVIALCFLVCLLIFGLYFLYVGKLTNFPFVFYLAIVLTAFLAFYSIDRLKELDLSKMRIVLNDIKEEKREIFAKAEAVKKLGEKVAEMVAYNVAMANRFVSDEDVNDRFNQRKKIENFLEEIGTDEKRSKEIVQSIDNMIIFDLLQELLKKAGYVIIKNKENEQWFNCLNNEILINPSAKIDIMELKNKLLESSINFDEIPEEFLNLEFFLVNRALRE